MLRFGNAMMWESYELEKKTAQHIKAKQAKLTTVGWETNLAHYAASKPTIYVVRYMTLEYDYLTMLVHAINTTNKATNIK